MKIKLLFAIYCLTLGFLKAQSLITNGSFETLNFCPTAFSQVTACASWYPAPNNIVPPNATDYLNACNTGSVSVPSNPWGYQVAHSGNGYMALATMAPQIALDYRENIYTQLTTPLVVGNTYSVSMYVSHTDNSQNSTNNLGLKFSTVPSFPINNIAHVNTTTVITDNINWVQISGSFVADSAYRYLAVGNFFTDANTTTSVTCSSCLYNERGYFIDDVSVIQASIPTCTITINGSQTICSGQSSTLTASGANAYTWNTGATTTSIIASPTVTTTYTVIGTTSTCTNQAVTAINVISSSPIISISGSNTTCPGQNITLTASGANTYTWSSGATTTSVVLNPTVTTTYTVTGGIGTCTSQAVAVIGVDDIFSFTLPNIITPNNDGINDFIDFRKYQFSTMQLQIYNRWGIRIYESNDPISIWKPTVIDDGTYFYIIQYTISCNGEIQGETLKGFITSIK